MLIDIDKLKPHNLAVSLVPRMTEVEYISFLEDIKKNGILTPIEIIPDNIPDNDNTEKEDESYCSYSC